MKICFASNNQKKLHEVRQKLSTDFQLLSLRELGCTDEIAETGTTLEANSRIKARYVRENYQTNCFADDTGLEVEALNGAPGVYSARFAGTPADNEANLRLLLEKMQHQPNRRARFRTVITLVIDSNEWQFEGVANGEIIQERRGEGGFGYDPVFVPEGYTQTFAQLPLEEKNRISHRGRAVQKLVDFLQQHNT